jgi:hypothetical protein
MVTRCSGGDRRVKEHLTGIDARDHGIAALCEAIAPADHRVLITHTAVPVEDLGARLTPEGPVDGDGTPLWIYGSTLPRDLLERYTKVQVHEPFADDAPAWFDRRFPRYIRDSTLPGYSCFSPASLVGATRRLLDEYREVRLKDPNGNSGVGQWTVSTVEEIEPTLAAVASDVGAGDEAGLAEYLAEHGYVVEAQVEDVEAWSVTLTRTPGGHFSSFGRLLEPTVDTADRGTLHVYGGTTAVVVRGEPSALADLPDGGVVAHDPVLDDIRLTPSAPVVHAAQRYIEGLRLWEADGAFETRANVDVITGTVVRRDGAREEIAACVEESGRVGGASPAELLGIIDLQADPDLPYAVRCTRHSFDAAAHTYADHVATVSGSRVFWVGVDHGWDDKYVFLGAF